MSTFRSWTPGLASMQTEPSFKEIVGRHSWAVMHAVADQYPDNPTPEDREAAYSFLYSFAHLYPCYGCRPNFQKLIREFPPDVRSKAAFQQWMSCFHDKVSIHLGKAPMTDACQKPPPGMGWEGGRSRAGSFGAPPMGQQPTYDAGYGGGRARMGSYGAMPQPPPPEPLFSSGRRSPVQVYSTGAGRYSPTPEWGGAPNSYQQAPLSSWRNPSQGRMWST